MRRDYAHTLSFGDICGSYFGAHTCILSVRFLVSILILVSLQGCFFNAARYKGDGSFTDNGWMNYGRRYVLDLGSVDLSKPGAFSFELTGLPNAQFAVGIDVLENLTPGPDRQFNQPTRVKLEMQTDEGKVVIVEEGALDTWVLTSAYPDPFVEWARFYKRGETEEILAVSGKLKTIHLNVKHSEGWGTYFTASRSGAYILDLAVLESEKYATAPAKLVLVGWDRTLYSNCVGAC